MKKVKNILILSLIGLSLLNFRCGCDDPVGHDQDVRVWTISPAIDEVIHTQRVTFEWDYIDDGRDFESAHLFLYLDAGIYHHIDEYITEADRKTFCIDTLTPSTTYYWSITLNLEDRVSRSSEKTVFTMADELLLFGEVHTPTPDSGSIGISVNPVFSWEVYDPDTVGYSYDLYLGTTDTPSLLVSGLGILSYNLTTDTLDYLTQYYWRVVAYNSQDTVFGPLWEFTTDYPVSSQIYAIFEIDAQQSPSGYHLMEEIRTRLDSAYADVAVTPLQADSIKIEDVLLDWNSTDQNYSYTEISMPFIENGQPVNISIFDNGGVPNLNTSVNFPACTLAIISPESFDNIPISGFEVTWDGSECGGNVILALLDGTDSTGVWKEVANDGTDSLTEADLLPLDGHTGTYDLYLIKQVEENITSTGYLTQSLVRSRIINRMPQVHISSK